MVGDLSGPRIEAGSGVVTCHAYRQAGRLFVTLVTAPTGSRTSEKLTKATDTSAHLH